MKVIIVSSTTMW